MPILKLLLLIFQAVKTPFWMIPRQNLAQTLNVATDINPKSLTKSEEATESMYAYSRKAFIRSISKQVECLLLPGQIF